MATHKLSSAVFAQGWLDGQFESFVDKAVAIQSEDPTALVIATQMRDQWGIVSSAFDRLIKENGEMERRLSLVKAAIA
jgi:hypothetical protein